MTPEKQAALDYWTNLLDRRWDSFRKTFSLELEKILDKIPDKEWRNLDVDYDPSDLLLDALHASGIPCLGCLNSADRIFPFKHRSRLGPGYFYVSEGRGAERRYLIGAQPNI